MRIPIGNAFAGNNSGSNTIIASFPSAELAAEVLGELAAVSRGELRWLDLAKRYQLEENDNGYEQWSQLHIFAIGIQVFVHGLELPAGIVSFVTIRGGSIEFQSAHSHSHHIAILELSFPRSGTDPDTDQLSLRKMEEKAKAALLIEILTAPDGLLTKLREETPDQRNQPAWHYQEQYATLFIGVMFDELMANDFNSIFEMSRQNGMQGKVTLFESFGELDSLAFLRQPTQSDLWQAHSPITVFSLYSSSKPDIVHFIGVITGQDGPLVKGILPGAYSPAWHYDEPSEKLTVGAIFEDIPARVADIERLAKEHRIECSVRNFDSFAGLDFLLGLRSSPTGISKSSKIGDIVETIELVSNEKTLKFSRGGQNFSLSSKDGPIQILPDKTVVQEIPELKIRNSYWTSGVVETVKADRGTNGGEPAPLSVRIPNGDGTFTILKNGYEGVKNLSAFRILGIVAVTITDDSGYEVPTVFRLNDECKSVQLKNESFWRVYDDKAQFWGTAAKPGPPVWSIRPGCISGRADTIFAGDSWHLAEPPIGSNGELLLLGTGSHDGSNALLRLDGVAIIQSKNIDTFIYPHSMKADYVSDKLASITLGVHTYTVDLPATASAEQGPIKGLLDASGNFLAVLPHGVAYHFDKTAGKFISESSITNGIKSMYIWNPGTNTYTIKKDWKTVSGEDRVLDITFDAQDDVLHFVPPGGKEASKAGGFTGVQATFNKETQILTVILPTGTILHYPD